MGNDIPISGIWRHYKGHRYLVLGVGQNTETDEKMVVYVPLYEDPTHTGPALRLRPASQWFEMVRNPETIHSYVERFTFVGHER